MPGALAGGGEDAGVQLVVGALAPAGEPKLEERQHAAACAAVVRNIASSYLDAKARGASKQEQRQILSPLVSRGCGRAATVPAGEATAPGQAAAQSEAAAQGADAAQTAAVPPPPSMPYGSGLTYCSLLTIHLLRRRFTNCELHTTTKVAQQLGGGGSGINGGNGSAAPVWLQVSQGVHSLNCVLDEQREKPIGADEVSK